ncbi:hypothetical protein EDB85DRAFT_2249877 [Lactarius pseudohatsudake]|nr:hypothetical protein EDB85DRAFT_2249877 [Lactarius pseudohatsudake]
MWEEEITCFDKAQSDMKFGKMLKSRFLSPKQTELQTQLHRNIQSIQDQVTKMEDHLQASKKKLKEFKTGWPSIKLPLLDTINRTSRNINLTICQQTVDVSALLSAHYLKEALLAVGTEPLLNIQAAHAKPTPRAFDTPQRQSVDLTASASASKGFSTPFTLPPLSVGAGPSSSPPMGTGRWSSAQKYHSKSVPLKSTPTGGTPPKLTFDWGPLPGIKPMTMLSSDLRLKMVPLLVVSGGCKWSRGCKFKKWPQITLFPWSFLPKKNTCDKEERGVVKSKGPDHQIPTILLNAMQICWNRVLEETNENAHDKFGVISYM